MMRTAVVVANPDKPEALRLATLAERELSKRGVTTVMSTTQGEDLSDERPEVAVVFGGDGTVLGAVAAFGDDPPPILAFNLGRLGYLADNPPERMSEILDDALDGKLRASRRMMVEAVMKTPEGEWRRSALNEFALVIKRHGRLLPLSVWVNNEELMEIRADGIVVATATGSTAYALAAGGPVASPELAALILAPICPHQLANRSLVLDQEESVTITHMGDTAVELVADGMFCCMVEKGQPVTCRMSGSMVSLLSQSDGRYKVLREKLGWGWGWKAET